MLINIGNIPGRLFVSGSSHLCTYDRLDIYIKYCIISLAKAATIRPDIYLTRRQTWSDSAPLCLVIDVQPAAPSHSESLKNKQCLHPTMTLYTH